MGHLQLQGTKKMSLYQIEIFYPVDLSLQVTDNKRLPGIVYLCKRVQPAQGAFDSAHMGFLYWLQTFATGEALWVEIRRVSASGARCSASPPCGRPRLYGQGTTATISGNVTDSTGASVAGAKVIATNLGTNLVQTATTASDGSYSLLFLPVGNYKVEINAAGFKKFDQTGITLDVNRNARVDAALQVGAITETVEVSADASMVETSVPGLGQTTTNTEIDNLPLVNRDIYTLLNLTAGVDTTDQATDNFGAPMQVTVVNGSPNSGIGSVNYSLNGGSNINGLRNTGNSAPNPDAIQEFRVLTNSYPADEGRFGGATVTMISKSGTNELHGTLFEFLRNDKLNANRWLPGQTILQKDPLHRNQFGGTAGGPIVRNRPSSSEPTPACASAPACSPTPPLR